MVNIDSLQFNFLGVVTIFLYSILDNLSNKQRYEDSAVREVIMNFAIPFDNSVVSSGEHQIGRLFTCSPNTDTSFASIHSGNVFFEPFAFQLKPKALNNVCALFERPWGTS